MDGVVNNADEVYRLVYFGGCQHNIRKDVWPYLLGHYSFGTTIEQRAELDETNRHYYETTMSEWLAVEAIVRQRDKEKTASAVAKLSSEGSEHQLKIKQMVADAEGEIENDVFEENGFSDLSDPEDYDEEEAAAKQNATKTTSMCVPANAIEKPSRLNKSSTDSGNVADSGEDDNKEPDEVKLDDIVTEATYETVVHAAKLPTPEHDLSFDNAIDNLENLSNKSTPSSSSYETVANDFVDLAEQIEELKTATGDDTLSISSPTGQRHSVIITDASIDIVNIQNDGTAALVNNDFDAPPTELASLQEEAVGQTSLDALHEPKSACVSPASSNGGIYSVSESYSHKTNRKIQDKLLTKMFPKSISPGRIVRNIRFEFASD